MFEDYAHALSEEDRWKERQRQENEEAYYAAMRKEQEGKELNNDE